MKSNSAKTIWLEKGYEHFANYGPEKLSINKISNEMGSSRASFYHYFGDIDGFREELLDFFYNKFEAFNTNGNANCKTLLPDLYFYLAENEEILRFARQLFLHRHIPVYTQVFSNVFTTSSKNFMLKLFVEKFDLDYNEEKSFKLWFTVSEAWFSRLDPNDLSGPTLLLIGKDVLKSVFILVSEDLYNMVDNS